MIEVLLAEDHETVREGLRLLVNAQDDMRVIGEAGDGKAAIEQAQSLKPNVVVLDLSMPQVNGVVAAQALRSSVPSAAVVTLTRHRDSAYVRQLLAAGASGYVLKQSSSNELLKAIRAAAAGGNISTRRCRRRRKGRDVRRRRRRQSRSARPPSCD